MKSVQTAIYRRTAPNHYESINDAVIGERIKILQTRRTDLRAKGANISIFRDSHSSHLITGLIPLKGLPNRFYGDYHRESIGVYYNQEWPEILVVLFANHRVKRRSTRAAKVGEFFRKMELAQSKQSNQFAK